MSARHAMTFAAAQSRYDAMLPPEDDRYVAEQRAAERIEADADQVRELVLDNLDATDSPVMSNEWTAGLLIALREAKPIFNALCRGYTLEQAMAVASGADHFRALLACAETADSWIAEQITAAASDAMDDAAASWHEDRGEARFDALNGGW